MHDGLGTGVFYRRLYLIPSRYLDNVASRLRIRVSHHSQYTDWHDIDEDVRNIPALGGWCTNDSNCGIFDRDLYSSPSTSAGVVASRLAVRAQSKRRNSHNTRTITISMKICVLLLIMVIVGVLVCIVVHLVGLWIVLRLSLMVMPLLG